MESMEQTFNDLYKERRDSGKGSFGLVLGMFGDTAAGILKEHVLLFTRGKRMKENTANYKVPAIISFFLALPCMVLFSLIILNIEPNFGPLEPILNNPDPDQPDVVGSLVALSTLVMLAVAFGMNVRIISRARREGRSYVAHPVVVALAVIMLAFLTSIVGAIVVDQYPCWVGVPNCD